MAEVNPEILHWARKTAGLSLEEAVKRLKISDARGESAVERHRAMETGVIGSSLLFLLDANVLINANRDYYPIDRVPELWEWLVHVDHGSRKNPRIC
jgi:hypothetical protein